MADIRVKPLGELLGESRENVQDDIGQVIALSMQADLFPASCYKVALFFSSLRGSRFKRVFL